MVTITECFKKLVRKVDVLLLFVLKFLYNICMCMIHFDMPFFLIMVISVYFVGVRHSLVSFTIQIVFIILILFTIFVGVMQL